MAKESPPYENAWSGHEVLDGRLVPAEHLILKTRGCGWYDEGGCTMCGFPHASDKSMDTVGLRRQMEAFLEVRPSGEMLKVYTSGSFLDPSEVTESEQVMLLAMLKSHYQRLLVESRPQHVTPAAADRLNALGVPIDIAFGLESTSDRLLGPGYIHKGFTWADFLEGSGIARDHGIGVKTYLLLKPIRLTEAEAITDTKRSLSEAAPHSDRISLNPINVQARTPTERLWQRGEYRPPWLWSVVEVLRTAKIQVPVVCHPTGGGQARGTHNCGRCDTAILAAIDRFNLSQDPSVFSDLACRCQEDWDLERDLQAWIGTGGPLLSQEPWRWRTRSRSKT